MRRWLVILWQRLRGERYWIKDDGQEWSVTRQEFLSRTAPNDGEGQTEPVEKKGYCTDPDVEFFGR